MQNKLKRSYSVKKECSQKNTFTGFIEAKEVSRLAESVVSVLQDIEVSFQIFTGFGHAPEFKGNYKTSVSLQCQRCLDNLDFDIEHNFHFYIGENEEELGEDYSGYEFVATEDGDLLDIVSIIEDDILLNLPLIPKHETDCNKHLLKMNKEADALEEVKKNPFAVLEGLKTNLKH